MMQEEEEKERSIFGNSPSKEEAEALLQISKWTRIISVIGFGIGSFIVILMLFDGAQILKGFAATMPGAVGLTYPIVVAGFFVIFFVAALVLYYLYKSSLLLLQGLQQKNDELLSQAFIYLRNFFIALLVLGILQLAGNLTNLL